MPPKDTHQHRTTVERVIETVTSWPEITTKEGRFNATAFQIGNREIGHVHPEGMVDISYQPALRDQLIADGRTEAHHFAPNSPTGTTFHIESEDDIDNAIWLFRLSYLHHLRSFQKYEEMGSKLDDINVESELDKLDPNDVVHSVFVTTEVT